MPKPLSFAGAIRVWVGLLALTLACFVVLVCLPLFLIFYDPNACLTETHKKIIDLSGLDFEISETNCDVIAKEDWVDVSVARTGWGGKTLLFRYDPGHPDNPLPTISRPDPRTIHIAIPWVSEILLRQYTWQGMAVTYDIGRVEYPAPEPAKK